MDAFITVDFPPRFAQLNGKVPRQVCSYSMHRWPFIIWVADYPKPTHPYRRLQFVLPAVHSLQALGSQFAFELQIHSSCLLSVAIFYVYLQKSSGNSLFSRHCRYSESKLNCIAAIVRQVSCSNIFLQFVLIFYGFAYQIFMRNRRRNHKVTIKFLL